MTDKINGYGRIGLDPGPARARTVNRSEGDGAPDETQRSGASRDAVELTGTAARLKSVEARLAGLPDVDKARVDAIRKRIESGEYQPDPARIAQKLIRLEQDLA
jgi:negative regulator of flagellin synthesis FlgM